MKWLITIFFTLLNCCIGLVAFFSVCIVSVKIGMRYFYNPLDSLSHDYLSPLMGVLAGIGAVLLASLLRGRIKGQSSADIRAFTLLIGVILTFAAVALTPAPLDD